VLLGVFGVWKGRETPIGDTQAGVPELRPDSRYNQDSNVITSEVLDRRRHPERDRRDQGVRLHQPRVYYAIDIVLRGKRKVEGVQDVMSLPIVAKIAIAGCERGQPQVAQHSRASPRSSRKSTRLHRDQHRAARTPTATSCRS
jgi:hypothetical protein